MEFRPCTFNEPVRLGQVPVQSNHFANALRFGYDGPELIQIGGAWYLYFRCHAPRDEEKISKLQSAIDSDNTSQDNPRSMARIVLDNVSKSFTGPKGEEVRAVNNVSLAVEDKEFVVLVGPSGCGKSTTLRMIAGLEEISSGTISIDGRIVNGVEPKDRDVAMVFQNYALYPHMTV